MASLTQTSIAARKVIRFSLYTIIFVTIARFVYFGAVALYLRLFPPPPPKASVAFGKLPKLPFPVKDNFKNQKFTLELPEGNLPTLPPLTEVYSMPEPLTSINVLEEAKKKAQLLGFSPDGKILVETIPNVYRFTQPNTPSSLTMNIVTGVFSVSYNISQNPSVTEGVPPDPETAKTQGFSFLDRASLSTEDLENGVATHEFLRIENGQFVKTISLSESNLIKVNFFRRPYGQAVTFPSVTPDMPEANVWIMMAGGQARTIVAAEYHYFPIEIQKFATYPLKTSQQAWDELQKGSAFFANAGDKKSDNVVIRRVYLAYYDPGQYAKYYQPVIVFEGDDNFFAYVPAVTDEYYGE